MTSINKKILILGSNGQLGMQLQDSFANLKGYELTLSKRGDFDLKDQESVRRYLALQGPGTVINCLAYTAVDKAESEPELARLVNHDFLKSLGLAVQEIGSTLIHISTDFVFNGRQNVPYRESVPTDPTSVYGLTKRDGEDELKKMGVRGAIIRTSWLYSNFGANFYKTMLRLAKERDVLKIVYDQVGSPTYAHDLADFIVQNLEKISDFNSEIFHFSNEGVASWYDFAAAIFEYGAVKTKLFPIESHQYPTPAKRPHYSVLSKEKLTSSFGYEIPHWRDSLKKCLIEGQK